MSESIDKYSKGAFLVIEGTDGSGKGTQLKKLVTRLESEGYDVATFDFPQYDHASSYFVQKYLNGAYGTTEDVGPYTGSLFFSLDRYEAATDIRQALEDGKVVIANRYTGSNMAHQGTKFSHPEERRGFFIWLDNLEFQMLKIPRPDRSFVLRVPAEIAQANIDQKEPRNYTDKQRDIHEADLGHLQKSIEVYDDLCSLFPKDFIRIDCVRSGAQLSIDAVHQQLWGMIEPLLPAKSSKIKDKESVMNTEPTNPFIEKQGDEWNITDAGREFLDASITNQHSDVYAFRDGHIGNLTIAAAMARLSRRGDDMRVTLLDEFAATHGKDEGLLRRVITAYGDDSVQQLVGQHIVVENASNLLTKQLEWGRLASYLEQSTRYIYFDKKDKDGKYKYYTPDHLNETTKQLYDQSMDQIFDAYSNMVHKLTEYIADNSNTPESERDGAWRSSVRAQACDAVRAVLPVATKSTVGIFASGQALESMIMRLRASDSKEAIETGDRILEEARKVIPTFLERADKPERGGATTAYLANTRRAVGTLATKHLEHTYGNPSEAVSLHSFWPRNELDLVPHMLYEHSDLSLEEITHAVDGWSMDQKLEVFHAYIGERLNRRHKPGRALEQAHYTYDLICDYGSFRDLQRHRMVDDLQWQTLTPRYGFDVPRLVEDAGLTELYEGCFDLAAELYSMMQQAGYEYEAQYATLLGHKMRWKVTYNAREAFHLHELRTSPQGHPGYRKLVKVMHQKLSEKHPMLGEAMRFVNKDEDPELTRLAAERYTQFKLNNLD